MQHIIKQVISGEVMNCKQVSQRFEMLDYFIRSTSWPVLDVKSERCREENETTMEKSIAAA